MQPYSIKKRGDHYRGNSPFRAGSDSSSFVIHFESENRGTWYDHVDEVGGSIRQLAEHFGLAAALQISNTKRKYNGIKDYATAHGLDAETLQAYGWREHEHHGRKCLAFKTDSGWRYRFLDGGKPHYINEKGYERCWYGLGGAWLGRVADGQPAVFCNGEISTVAGHAHDLAAFCMTSGEKAAVPDDLLTELKNWFTGMMDREIIIAMDCDDKGRRVGLGLQEQLSREGFNVRAVDLGLGKAGDLADFVMLHGEDAAQALRSLPPLGEPDDDMLPVKGVPKDKVIATGRTWMMMHAADRHLIPPVEWIVPGEIPARGLTVVYGPSGVGKSFYIIDIALKIAQEHPVVYMALEGEGGVPSRIDAWCKHHNKDVGKLILSLGTVSFFDDNDLSDFLTGCQRVEPVMVIVDTLARSMVGADENSTRDMNKYTAQCSKIMATLGVAVVLVHHTGKTGDAERGSSVLRGACDSMIALVDDDEFVQVKCSKTKDAKPFPTRDMMLLPVDVGVIDAHGSPLETPVMVAGERSMNTEILELTVQQREVLQTLSLSTFEFGANVSDLVEVVHGVSRRGVFRILDRLKTSGLVSQPAARKPYTLTNKGRKMLGLPETPLENGGGIMSDESDTSDGHDASAQVPGPSANNSDSAKVAGTTVTSRTSGTSEPLFSEEELRHSLSPNELYSRTTYSEGL
jgi:hypothetical protein